MTREEIGEKHQNEASEERAPCPKVHNVVVIAF